MIRVKLILWDVKGRREIAVLSNIHTTSVSFSPDSQTLASMGYDYSAVYLWDVATGARKNFMPTRQPGGFYNAGFSPDSKNARQRGRRWHGASMGCSHSYANRDAQRT